MKTNPWYYRIDRELIKERKPCTPGDYIHMHGWSGCFRVDQVFLDYFVVYKNRQLCKVPWRFFKCLKGQGTSEKSLIRKEINALEILIQLQDCQNKEALIRLKTIKHSISRS